MNTLLFLIGTEARGKMAWFTAIFESGKLAEKPQGRKSLVVALLG
jgi:hypothetical protein